MRYELIPEHPAGFYLADTWTNRLSSLLGAVVCVVGGAVALWGTLLCVPVVYQGAQAGVLEFWPAAGALAAGTATIAAGYYLRGCVWNVIRRVPARYGPVASGAVPVQRNREGAW